MSFFKRLFGMEDILMPTMDQTAADTTTIYSTTVPPTTTGAWTITSPNYIWTDGTTTTGGNYYWTSVPAPTPDPPHSIYREDIRLRFVDRGISLFDEERDPIAFYVWKFKTNIDKEVEEWYPIIARRRILDEAR